MSTYSYVSNAPYGTTKILNGVSFVTGVPVTYNSDQIALNAFVPEYLDRYIDGVKSNEGAIAPYSGDPNRGYSLLVDLASVGSIVSVQVPNSQDYTIGL